MDFYEELGVSRNAGEEEIRKSYKCLTLLLHPDLQQNPDVRILAEGQMKRINEIISILTNPERRRIYDETLAEKPPLVRQIEPVPWIPWIRDHRGWMLVAMAFLLLLISPLLVPMFDSGLSDQVHHSATSSAASARAPDQWEVSSIPSGIPPGNSPSRLPRADRRMSDAKSVPGPAANPTTAERPPDVEEFTDGALLAKSASDAVIPVPPAPIRVALPAPTLAGRWVYTPDPGDIGDPKLYPAEYVELSIVLADGMLRGVYHARYKLADRTLNSRVAFTFEGPAAGTSFVWQGDSGAKGEIGIRMQSPDTLKVNWFATKMGSALSLGSGNATLYRFR